MAKREGWSLWEHHVRGSPNPNACVAIVREEFLEVLDYERFTVHSLKAKGLQVSSFPTLKYPEMKPVSDICSIYADIRISCDSAHNWNTCRAVNRLIRAVFSFQLQASHLHNI